jgi:ABC-type transport system involved in multi-copper enzyme maturation permease subunit
MSDNLRRYSLWQMRDFIRDRGVALLIIGLALGFTFISPVKMMNVQFTEMSAKQLLGVSFQQIVFICAFVALNGVVSNDRKQGYFRFLFSKPVSIPEYYAQQFVIYFVGFLVAMAILLGLFAIFVFPLSPVAPLTFCAIVFLSLGGIAFFISSLFRFDWPILAAVFLGSALLHTLWEGREGWRKLVISVLPPLNKLSAMLGSLLEKGTVDTNDTLWLIGYSLLFFLAGLYVLRRRPIS